MQRNFPNVHPSESSLNPKREKTTVSINDCNKLTLYIVYWERRKERVYVISNMSSLTGNIITITLGIMQETVKAENNRKAF